jgi:hypothetical protein
MAWVKNTSGRRLKELQALHADVRSAVREDVANEVSQEPVHRAIRWLAKGESVVDGKVVKEDGPHKLDAASVQEILKEDSAAQELLKAYTRKTDGQHPDDVAVEFGFNTGEQLLRAILDTPSLDTVVDAKTDKIMLERYSEFSSPKEIDTAIQKSLRTEARERFLAAQFNHLTRSRKPVREQMLAARDTARRLLDERKVKLISPPGERILERRAGRQLEDALKTADAKNVLLAAHKQVLQYALVNEANKVEAEITKALKKFKSVWRADAVLDKTHNLDFVNAARAILSSFGLGQGTKLPLELVDKIAKYRPEVFKEIMPHILRATNNNTLQSYLELSVDDFRMVRDIVEKLLTEAKLDKQLTDNTKQVEKAAAVAKMTAELRAMPSATTTSLEGRLATKKERLSFRFLSLKAWGRRMEHWTRKIGPVFTKHIFRETRERFNDYLLERNVYLKDYIKRHEKLSWWTFKVPVAINGNTTFVFEGRNDLVGALSQSGTKSNLENFLLGYKLAERDSTTGLVNTAEWWAFIEDQVAQGRLTEEDFDFVQANWDQHQALLPQSQATWFKLNGNNFEEEKAVPFTIRFPNGNQRNYSGGYMPSKVDTKDPANAHLKVREDMGGLEGLEAAERDLNKILPVKVKKFGVKRTGGVFKRRIDANVQLESLDEVLRFIHLQAPINDVISLIRDPELREEINRVDPTAIDDLIIPWVVRTYRNQIATPGGNPSLNAFFTYMRRTASMVRLFGRLINSAIQLSGLSNALPYIKSGGSIRATAWRYVNGGSREMRIFNRANSNYMRLLATGQTQATKDDIEIALNPTKLGRAQRLAANNIHVLQSVFQNITNDIVWHAAFDGEMANSQNKDSAEALKDAIAEADSAVRLSQGSSSPVDAARFEAGTPWMRMFTLFTGYNNNVLNAIVHAEPGLARAKVILQSLVTPSIVAATITAIFSGGWDDDDEDGYLGDDIASFYLRSLFRDSANLVPVAGYALTSFVQTDKIDQSIVVATFTDALQGISAAAEAAENLALDNSFDKTSGKDIGDILTAVTFATRLPFSVLTPPLKFLRDVYQDKATPSGPWDYAMGLVSGRSSANVNKKQ